MNKDFLKRFEKNKDELTGLFRRDALSAYMDKLTRDEIPFSFVILDIDNFKTINDSYGHQIGDYALKLVADSLKAVVGDKGVVGRFGGDEFIFVFPELVEYDDVWHMLLNILQSAYELRIPDTEVKITYTAGVSRYPLDTDNIDVLLNLADKALYRGKVKGRNCFIIYLPEKHANINLKTERDKIVSSMYLHSKVFNALTKSKKIKNGVKETINFLGNYFMIDHLCLTDDNGLYCEYFHPLCKKRDFKLYKKAEIGGIINTSLNMFYLNSTAQDVGDKKVVKDMLENAIYSVIYCEVAVYGKFFGYIRADVAENPRGRVWQNLDMDVLLNFAHVLAIELYYQHMDLADLDD